MGLNWLHCCRYGVLLHWQAVSCGQRRRRKGTLKLVSYYLQMVPMVTIPLAQSFSTDATSLANSVSGLCAGLRHAIVLTFSMHPSCSSRLFCTCTEPTPHRKYTPACTDC